MFKQRKNNVNLMDTGGKKFLIIAVVSIVIIFFLIFTYIPVMYGIVGSFAKWSPIVGGFDLVGLKNYIRMFKDPLFIKSILHTLYFAIVVTIGRIVLGLILAVLIDSVKRFKSFFRTVYFLPVIISMFAASLLWKWLYDPNTGLFNTILIFLGLPGLRWLNDPGLALPSIMLMTIWKTSGFAMVLFLAGLTAIPQVYREASYIDGANKWQSFKFITVPLLKPTIFFVIIISIIEYFQAFVQIYVMTTGAVGSGSGGIGYSAVTTPYLIYDAAYRNFDFGYGSAIAVMLFIISLFFIFMQIRMLRKGGMEID